MVRLFFYFFTFPEGFSQFLIQETSHRLFPSWVRHSTAAAFHLRTPTDADEYSMLHSLLSFCDRTFYIETQATLNPHRS